MTFIEILFGFVAILAVFFLLLFLGSRSRQYSYRKRNGLFTPAERSFLNVLHQVVGDKARVYGKVRVADVLEPKTGMFQGNWQVAFNKINAKHFDFVICHKNDLSVVCVIELNDSSHNSSKRAKRDAFLEKACHSAKLPLIQVTARRTYDANELRKTLAPYLSSRQKGVKYSNRTQTERIHKPGGRKCPQCSAPLVKRTVRKGKNAGNQFWGCRKFPECRYTKPV